MEEVEGDGGGAVLKMTTVKATRAATKKMEAMPMDQKMFLRVLNPDQ